MIDGVVGFVERLWLLPVLSVGDVVIVLALATASVLGVSIVLGAFAVASRIRRAARRREVKEEFRVWQRSLHAVLYDGAPLETLWQAVGNRNDLDVLSFLVEYVRRLGGAERDRVCALAEPYLPRLLPRLADRSEGTRLRAVQTLGELGLPRYTTQVVGSLDDPSPLVAMVAAGTLARAETPEYASEVLARAGRFVHWRQDFLASMLASMGRGAAPALRRTLADELAPPRVRAVVADALATLGDPLGADGAERALTTSDDWELRAAALRLLASVGREEHLAAVRRELSAPEQAVRLAAIRALGQFGGPEDEPELERAALDDPSPWIALAAARALKSGGALEALETLAGSQHPRAALGLQVISEPRSL